MGEARGRPILPWLSRIGGRAQLIALTSLVVLVGQAAILVYGLNRGFDILSEILVRGGQATGAVDELATDLNTVGDSIVGVMAGVYLGADVGRHVHDRAAAMTANWPEVRRRVQDFVDATTVERAQESIEQMSIFARHLGEILPKGSSKALELLHEEWTDLANPLVRLVNRARARVLERSDAARIDADRLRRWVSVAQTAMLVAGFLVLGVTWYLLVVTIARPVTQIASTMTTLAEGRLDTPIPSRDRRDEIGDMAGAIEVFRAHAVERDGLLRERASAADRLEQLVDERTRELGRREAVLSDTFGHMDQGISLIDGDFNVVVHNRRFGEIWKFSGEVLDRHRSMLDLVRYAAERGDFRPRSAETVVAERLAILLRGAAFVDEAQLSDGTTIEIRGMPRNEGGYVITHTDITARKRAAEETERARAAAEAANEAKSSFLATMTHELRTPMNGVLGVLELLRQTPMSGEQRELTDVIGGSAEALLKIIDDILDLSKIEAGRMEVERIPLAPLALVEGVADTLSSHAHRKRLAFSTFVDPAVPVAVLGDPVRLRQVLFNLIGNAIKFTEAGGIGVEVGTVPRDGGFDLLVSVQDSGIGLSEEQCDRLFTPFVQADGTTTRRFGGTGLGLSICRRLVELMGGRIGVDSEIGQGSTFWFRIPTEASSDLPPPVDEDVAGLRVLLIEDDPTASRIFQTYLESAGADVDCAATAEEGLERLSASAATRPFDVAVVDFKLPGADGFECLRAVDADPRLRRTKAILVTAYNDPEQRGRALAAGFAAYLNKPVRRAVLLKAVAAAAGRVVAERSASAVGAPPGREPGDAAAEPPRRGRVLVAEDHKINQMVISRQLASLGFTTAVTDNGRHALEALHADTFDVVLTDCHMPDMDGFELTKAIRELERRGRKRVPIVALTANALQGEAARCLAAGMDDYLAKPVSLSRLDDVLRRWMKDGVGPAAATAPAPGNRKMPRGDGVGATAIDLDGLRQVIGESVDDVRHFMRRFVEIASPQLEDLAKAVADRTGAEATHLCHSLKGAAQSIMASELAGHLAAAEQAIESQAWAEASLGVAHATEAFGRVREFVVRY
jgi:signal transduction histidine kinase/DNA-binding response OmpR family regulator/HAMP domain-containing protein/HPt (histidine-containing phosphotransfer) domain-containing protein